ncbi:MAG: alpha-hydroxy acid oxidase [Planctomycetales bacterium]
MNRRLFAKWLALGTGALVGWQETAQAAPQSPRSLPDPDGVGAGIPNTGRDDLKSNPSSVHDLQALARIALPSATYDYITTGSTDEVTLRDNVEAFQRLRLLPPLLSGVAQVDTSVRALGQPVAMPILLAPVAGQSLFHREGVLASARAAAAAKTILGVSSSAGHSIEEIAAAAPGPKWFQLYVPNDRVIARKLVERAERADYRALVVTVDLGERKDADRRNRFALPPAVLRKHLRDVGFSITDDMSQQQLEALNDHAWDLSFSWDFFDWLRSITRLPLLIKGVLREEDATKAVAIGLEGIVVSNHGGRRLDGVPASITQLSTVVQAVRGRAEVYLDSGVRRGTDVLKAVALGAKAVLIGRPYAWGLAAGGEAGVATVLQLLREELESAMHACGCARVDQISQSLIVPGNGQ